MVAEYIVARLPLLFVFLSGIGFSLQSLVVKHLAEEGFHASFQCVFVRGLIQCFIASYFVCTNEDRRAGKGPRLFGNSSFVHWMLALQSIAGFSSITPSFLAIELIPMGDATVLVMLSPLLTAIMSYFFLGEPWRLPEFIGTVISLVGLVMVAKPPSIFGGSLVESTAFYTGVAYALGAAISASFGYLLVRILGTTAKMPWENVCFSQSLTQLTLWLPFMYMLGRKFRLDITAVQWCLLVLIGTIGACSQVLMTIGMQREKSAAATAMRMSDVAFGYLWQVLFTADALSLMSLGGAMLVTLSILIIVVYKDSSTTAASSAGAVELSSVHNAQGLEDSYALEEGFADSDVDVPGDQMPGKEGRFDFSALRAQLEDTCDDDSEWEGSQNSSKPNRQGGLHLPTVGSTDSEVPNAGDMDLSLHGEHGGLLNAQHRSHTSESNPSYLSKMTVPLFGGGDAGI